MGKANAFDLANPRQSDLKRTECKSASKIDPHRRPTRTHPRERFDIFDEWFIGGHSGSALHADGGSQAAPIHNYAGRYVVAGLDLPYEVSRWEAVVQRVNQWLQFVKLDLETPDLWAELQRDTELLGAASNKLTENTPFTPDEQKEVARRLEELATDLSQTHSLSEAQVRALDEKIDYLVKASGRLGRKDWLNTFIGVTLGFMLSAALPPESLRTILLTFLRAIGLLYPELPFE